MTRTKFKCVEVTKKQGWGNHQFVYDATFVVVVRGSEENKKFFAATPSGNIHIGTIAENVFEVGKEYFVDFTEAE